MVFDVLFQVFGKAEIFKGTVSEIRPLFNMLLVGQVGVEPTLLVCYHYTTAQTITLHRLCRVLAPNPGCRS